MKSKFYLRVARLSRVIGMTTLLCVLSVAALAQPSAPTDAGKGPANFAIIVDTSGSMVGLYQRRDPRPTLVLALVQSLITETMRDGDRLVVLPFDSKVHNQPGEFVAIENLKSAAALAQIKTLGLHPQPGKGTIRTAALGAGAKALRALANPTGDKSAAFGGGVIFVVTDADNDTVPTDSTGQALYQDAQSMQKSGVLTRLTSIPQSGIILEVWQLKGTAGTPQPKLESAISKVKALLKDILPDHIVSIGALTDDFENEKFTLTPEGKWKRTKDGFELPVTLHSGFAMLNFKGDIKPNIQLTDGNKKVPVQALLTFDQQPPTVVPGATLKGKLVLSGLHSLGVLSLNKRQYKISAQPEANGPVTTQPKLFDVPNPAAAARISEAIWVDPWQSNIEIASPLPALPPMSPPRWTQLLILLALIVVVFALWKLFGPKPVPPLTMSYRWDGEGTMTEKLSLDTVDSTERLSGMNVSVRRPSRDFSIVVTPGEGITLLDSSGNETNQMAFNDDGLLTVKDVNGNVRVAYFNFNEQEIVMHESPQSLEVKAEVSEDSEFPPIQSVDDTPDNADEPKYNV